MRNHDNPRDAAHAALWSLPFNERAGAMAVMLAEMLHREARARCVGVEAQIPATTLRLFRGFMDVTDNHLAYRHWEYLVDGESSYGRFCDSGADAEFLGRPRID